MPCHFSGIFHVSEFKDNKLLCSFNDENEDARQIEIIYYFSAAVDRPFPQAYEVVLPGHVYFITGSMSIQNKNLVVRLFALFFFFVFLTFLIQMNAILVHRQGLYSEIDVSKTIYKSLSEALLNMFLTMIGTTKVTQGITDLSALKDDFPDWKYFVGEFEQYIFPKKQVC